MNENIKNKDAEAAKSKDDSNLDKGLEDTFPASDPVSATRERDSDKSKTTDK